MLGQVGDPENSAMLGLSNVRSLVTVGSEHFGGCPRPRRN